MSTQADNAPQAPADPAPTLLAVTDRLCAELRPGTARASLDSSLDRDLGLDSLARVELLLRIEKAFGVKLPEHTLGSAETVRDLLHAILSADRAGTLLKETRTLASAPADAPPEYLESLPEVLEWHVHAHPDRIHIVFQREDGGEEDISYGKLWQQAHAVAASLREQQVEPGESVALMLPSAPEYFYVFFGVLLAGAIPVPIYPPARSSQIEEHFQRHVGILSNAQAVLLVTIEEAKRLARLLTPRVETLRDIVTPGELLQPMSQLLRTHAARSGDIAFLQYTSGSTGDPKGVELTHANLLANLRVMGKVARVTGEDVFVSWLPLYHDMGLIGAWFGSLYFAFPLVVMSPLTFLARPERWLWAIHRHRGTISAGPNFAYELCLRRIGEHDIDGVDLSSLRLLFNGAEPVSPDTMEAFAARFARFSFHPEALAPVYGLAESSVGLAFPPPGRGLKVDRIERKRFMETGHAQPAAGDDAHALRFVSCGQPLPGHELRVVDALGREVPERDEGRLEFKGPSCTRHYFRNPEKTAALFHGEWLDTGDRAYMADGELYLVGRVKDMVIRGGRHIFPDELEHAIGNVTGVRKGCVAAFGSPDPASGTERLIVLAETRETDTAAREQLRAGIATAVFDVLGMPADEIVLAPVRTVLKTSSGKIRRAATRDRYLQGLTTEPQRAVWRQIARLALAAAGPGWRRLWRTIKELVFALYAWLLVALLAPVAWTLAVLLPRPAWSWAAVRAVARVFLRLCTRSFDGEGLGYLPDQPCVLAINHASYLDGVVIIAALPRPFSFVAKQELRRSFVTRTFLEHIGAQFVERFDPERGTEDARRLTELVKTGHSLAFFPEGTFTRVPGLRPFRLGAFVAATMANAPVVPVSLRGTRSILRGDEWLARRGAIHVTIGEPLAPEGSDWAAAIRLRDAARQEILRHCGEPDLA